MVLFIAARHLRFTLCSKGENMRIVLALSLLLCLLPVQAAGQGFFDIARSYVASQQARADVEIARQQAEQLRLQNEMMRQEMARQAVQERREQEPRYDSIKATAARRAKARQKQEEQDAKARQAAFEYFVQNVKPLVVKVHPDFDRIVAGEGYWKWAEKQRPALKFAAFNSGDPEDIIWAIGEYKTTLAKPVYVPAPMPEKLTTR